ncbi:MAG: UDP-N-acetylmuramate dehydrogenase [candidate division Zixibacteria bacterium]|nr:UDP-N-acetylmuramate dehydrogenase [candidate division Zixibacteria bacterium]
MTGQLSTNPELSMAALLSAFGPNLEFARDLAPLSSFKTGGKASYFIAAGSTGEVTKAVSAARRLKIPFFVIGGGTNLLISDSGFSGLIIRVEVTGLKLRSETEIECGAGEELKALINFATENELTGLEFAAGIWGTVGGAIYGNAGAYGGEIGSVVSEVSLVDLEGRPRTVTAEYGRFAYRDSHFKRTREIIVSAVFKLAKGQKQAIEQKISDILVQREEKYCNLGNSAGCFFKNIPDPKEKYGKLSAGRLLDEVGAKELEVGGAKVFEKHANIIVNKGNASSQDIRRLADIMKKKVRDKFGVELTEEIVQIGDF